MAKSNKPNKQQTIILASAISLLVGLGGGYLLAGSNDSDTKTDSEMTSHSHKESGSSIHQHSHATKFEVSPEEAPSVSFAVTKDAKSGWNIKLATKDFTFTPDHVNDDNVLGEGHAHLYVDDKKIARLYGPDFHYDSEFEGTKTFRVTLNANDHSEYTVNGQAVGATKQVAADE